MSRRIQAEEIARLAQISPLEKARADIDAACKSEREVASRRLKSRGGDLSGLLEEPISHPTQLSAANLLDTSARSGNLEWTEWIHLKLALLTMRQRIFAPIIFGYRANDSHRQKVHTEAYGIEAALLEETGALRSAYTGENDRAGIAGPIAEVLTLALLNRADPSRAGARISNAQADRFHKVDSRYDVLGASNEPIAVSLQVKTWSETVELPLRVLQIGLYSILGDQMEGLETEKLVIRDAHGDLSQVEQSDLTDRARAVQSVIHDSSFLSSRI